LKLELSEDSFYFIVAYDVNLESLIFDTHIVMYLDNGS